MVRGSGVGAQVVVEVCKLDAKGAFEASCEHGRRCFTWLDRVADADEDFRALLVSHLVPQRDGDHERAWCAECDPGRSGTEPNRCASRQQVTLRKEPERASGTLSQQRCRECSDVARLLQRRARGAKTSDAPEEWIPLQLRSLHDSVPVAPEQVMREIQGDDRVPPRAMIQECDRGSRRVWPPRATDIDAREVAPEEMTSVSRVHALDDGVLVWWE